MMLKDGRLKLRLKGGPWNKNLAVVPQTTAVITVAGQRGRYVMGVWEDV